MATTFLHPHPARARLLTRAWPRAARRARHADPLLLLGVTALCGLGLLAISSATLPRAGAGSDPGVFLDRQLVSLAVGLSVMVALTLTDYRTFRVWAPVVYAGALLLLGLVLAQGTVVNASRSWLVVGSLQLQPSELAKPAVILLLGALFSEAREEAPRLRLIALAIALAAAPMLLILAQPDFGTFLVFAALTVGMLIVARVKVRWLLLLALLAVAAAAAVLHLGLLQDYQLARLTVFLDPGADALGAAWNVNQAQIAIGSGRLFGQGLFQGSQTALAYVPENHTDFIFTVIGEELGFLGAAAALGAFALVLFRGLRIAATARDLFGALLAGGIVTVLAFQMFINVGMTIGLMPVTGLPLPFVSYGGTSLIASLAMVGLLQNVAMHRYS